MIGLRLVYTINTDQSIKSGLYMKILITGATGLVGTRLTEELFLNGFDDIRILTRKKSRTQKEILLPVEVYEWNPEAMYMEEGALEGVNVVIHLAGDNIAEGRWTEEKKNKILQSRTLSSHLLIQEIKKLPIPPQKIISSSAVGIYGSHLTNDLFDSTSSLGNDFLANVCKEWEKNILNHNIKGLNTHFIRTGVVLANTGGALMKMLPAFMMGVAGKLGSGNQYMSWIHIDDLVNQFIFLLKNNSEQRVYNGVAPRPVTNKEFTKILGKVLSRPTLFPVPAFALKGMFGEMADILLKGQNVSAKEFLKEGFVYKYPNLEMALEDLLKHTKNGDYVFKKYLWIKKPVKDIFPFFSDENNLEKITPPSLKFKVLNKSTIKIQAGTLINYQLKIHGIPAKWQTEIKEYKDNNYFIDIQKKGPYEKWEHTHSFFTVKEGTLMKDEVIYRLPFGSLGRLFAGHFVKNDVNKIFTYRNETIVNSFS